MNVRGELHAMIVALIADVVRIAMTSGETRKDQGPSPVRRHRSGKSGPGALMLQHLSDGDWHPFSELKGYGVSPNATHVSLRHLIKTGRVIRRGGRGTYEYALGDVTIRKVA